jgi:hypothetical protein
LLRGDKGSLEPGKFADLALLSQDIFEVPSPGLPKTESVLTMVGGKIVYDAKALSMSVPSSESPPNSLGYKCLAAAR